MSISTPPSRTARKIVPIACHFRNDHRRHREVVATSVSSHLVKYSTPSYTDVEPVSAFAPQDGNPPQPSCASTLRDGQPHLIFVSFLVCSLLPVQPRFAFASAPLLILMSPWRVLGANIANAATHTAEVEATFEVDATLVTDGTQTSFEAEATAILAIDDEVSFEVLVTDGEVSFASWNPDPGAYSPGPTSDDEEAPPTTVEPPFTPILVQAWYGPMFYGSLPLPKDQFADQIAAYRRLPLEESEGPEIEEPEGPESETSSSIVWPLCTIWLIWLTGIPWQELLPSLAGAALFMLPSVEGRHKPGAAPGLA